MVLGSVARLADRWVDQERRVEAYRQTHVSNIRAHDVLIRALEAGVIAAGWVPKVLAAWREPQYEEFKPRTVWSLFNCFTEALKDTSLFALPPRTVALHGLLDQFCGGGQALRLPGGPAMNMEETFLTTIKRILMFLMASASIAMARPELQVYEGDDGNARIDYKGDTWARVYEYSPEELTRQAIERERAFAQLMLVAVGLAALAWIGFIIAAFCRRDGRKALRIFAAPFVIPVVIAIPVGAVLIVGAGVLIGLRWLFTTFPFLDPTYTIIALIVLWISIAWVKEYISNRKVFPHRIQRTSRITGQQTEIREIACSWAQLDRWDAGASMEEAFPHLSDDERRFLRIGTKHELLGDFQPVGATLAIAVDEDEQEITLEEQEAEVEALVKKYQEKGAFF